MPKDFTINDAICGGADDSSLKLLKDIFGENTDMNSNASVTLAVIGLVCVVVATMMLIYKVAMWLMSEGAINSNASVALVEFSAGSVGGPTSAPLDLYGTSVYARNLQDVDQFGYNDINPNAKPGEPGSAAWFVLNSNIMKCGSAPNPGNPWAWAVSENDALAQSLSSNPAVVAVKQAVAVSKAEMIDRDPAVVAARRAVIEANPQVASNATAIELSPQVVAAKDAVVSSQEDVKLVAQAVLAQPGKVADKVGDISAGTEKKEGFTQCPSIGRRMGDEPLTMSLMGY